MRAPSAMSSSSNGKESRCWFFSVQLPARAAKQVAVNDPGHVPDWSHATSLAGFFKAILFTKTARLSFLRQTGFSMRSTPCTWNTFFARSTPTQISFMVDSFFYDWLCGNSNVAPRCPFGEEESIPLLSIWSGWCNGNRLHPLLSTETAAFSNKVTTIA
jgi:hypothetical protein